MNRKNKDAHGPRLVNAHGFLEGYSGRQTAASYTSPTRQRGTRRLAPSLARRARIRMLIAAPQFGPMSHQR
jgi:hypothetical protein